MALMQTICVRAWFSVTDKRERCLNSVYFLQNPSNIDFVRLKLGHPQGALKRCERNVVKVIKLISKKYLKGQEDLVNYLAKVKNEETGATAVEYALIVGLIAVVIIAAVTLLGTQIRDIFNSITNAL